MITDSRIMSNAV